MFRRIIFEWIYTLVIHLGIRILQKIIFWLKLELTGPLVNCPRPVNSSRSIVALKMGNGLKLSKVLLGGSKHTRDPSLGPVFVYFQPSKIKLALRFLVSGQNHQLLKRSLLPTNQLMHHQLFKWSRPQYLLTNLDRPDWLSERVMADGPTCKKNSKLP